MVASVSQWMASKSHPGRGLVDAAFERKATHGQYFDMLKIAHDTALRWAEIRCDKI